MWMFFKETKLIQTAQTLSKRNKMVRPKLEPPTDKDDGNWTEIIQHKSKQMELSQKIWKTSPNTGCMCCRDGGKT